MNIEHYERVPYVISTDPARLDVSAVHALLRPLASWNPLWANIHGVRTHRGAWRRAPDWRGRLRAVFGPPEALGSTPLPPLPASPPRSVARYVAGHLAFAIAVTVGVVLPSGAPGGARLGAAVFVLATLGTLGGCSMGGRGLVTPKGRGSRCSSWGDSLNGRARASRPQRVGPDSGLPEPV